MSSAPSLCFSQATRRHRSPAPPCRWTAVGPRTEAARPPADAGGPVAATRQEETMDDHSSVARFADARRPKRQNERQIVLVLQGGGALGAYQAGVYHALHEHGIEPDCIIGTSIAAINASLIAGNPVAERLEHLKEFWTRMAYRPPFGVPAWTGLPDTISYWKTLLRGIPAFFEPNLGAFLGT